ncbi:MAG: ATP phosphoribosyltransferase [Candidatus Aureabacteria bacterium]|nr:ATP phosphoribosyltransferase [Candidatus Auribacterota bacterium]
MKKLIFGLPKGSLQEATYKMMKKAGFKISGSSRSYKPFIDDDEIEIILIRAQEMARYVEDGALDAGITGKDWIEENNARVIEMADLIYAKQGMRPVRWVLAVPENSKIKKPEDLQGKKIATEAVNMTKKYLKKKKIKAEVEFSWGATEIKPPELADAIVELTETGSSLRANNLKIIDTVLSSTTKLIMNKDSYKEDWKKKKVESIAILLVGALAAEKKVGIKLNIAKKDLSTILKILPALKKPTISALSEDGWVAVETIIEEEFVRKMIPELKKAGAEGIIEYPLNKVII